MPITSVKMSGKGPKQETLQINKAARKIRAKVQHFTYRDKDTRQIVYYIPSLEVTGYGETDAKAKKMLEFEIDQLCEFLIELTPTKLQRELKNLGWTHDKIKTKHFSKAYVDAEGNLKQFNAVGDNVQVGILQY